MDLHFEEDTGVWDSRTSHCEVPSTSARFVRHAGTFTRYRVRAWATNVDGSRTTLYFYAANLGL